MVSLGFQEATGKATISCSPCFGGQIDQNFSPSFLETARLSPAWTVFNVFETVNN
jgi:hypothetical protein